MTREAINEIIDYFQLKGSLTPAEESILATVMQQKDRFPIAYLDRRALDRHGYDSSTVSDDDMVNLAALMGDYYCDSRFSGDLEEACNHEDIEMLPTCPKCGSTKISTDALHQGSLCGHCDMEWGDRFVLVEYPEDSIFFEDRNIGYHCANSEDNDARYVTEYDYIAYFHKKPSVNSYFRPVCWPDSQKYLELTDNTLALCENINDEEGLGAFGPSAIWVPECLDEIQD